MNEANDYGHAADGKFYGYLHKPLQIIFSNETPDFKILWANQEDSKYSFITDVVFEYKKDIEAALARYGIQCEVLSLEKLDYDYEYAVGLKVDDKNTFLAAAEENAIDVLN